MHAKHPRIGLNIYNLTGGDGKMDIEHIKKYAGKNVRIILKNNYSYKGVLPLVITPTFDIPDKYGSTVSIDCEMIGTISEVY